MNNNFINVLLTILYSGALEYNLHTDFALGLIDPSIEMDDSIFNSLMPEKGLLLNLPWTIPTYQQPLPSFDPQLVLHMNTDTPQCNDNFTSRDRLLWNPGPSGSTPPLVKQSMQTLLRVIKTWPKMLAKGLQTPPMIHFSHADPNTVLQPMANCIAIAKMWAGQSDGATKIIHQTIIQEMRWLFDQVSQSI